jgi:hypothetical protein
MKFMSLQTFIYVFDLKVSRIGFSVFSVVCFKFSIKFPVLLFQEKTLKPYVKLQNLVLICKLETFSQRKKKKTDFLEKQSREEG